MEIDTNHGELMYRAEPYGNNLPYHAFDGPGV